MSVLATVHLVRHGEVFNPDRVLYGRLPGFGLSELGLQMADGVAEWFVERANRLQRQPAIVAASPLERAQQTAAPIAAAFGNRLETEPNLIEAENDFEGMSNVAATLKSTPSLWPKLRNPARPSWGEPYVQQVQRMVEVVQRSRDVAEDRRAVLPGHREDEVGEQDVAVGQLAGGEGGDVGVVAAAGQLRPRVVVHAVPAYRRRPGAVHRERPRPRAEPRSEQEPRVELREGRPADVPGAHEQHPEDLRRPVRARAHAAIVPGR